MDIPCDSGCVSGLKGVLKFPVRHAIHSLLPRWDNLKPSDCFFLQGPFCYMAWAAASSPIHRTRMIFWKVC